MDMLDVVIIGSGPSGLTAAIYCQRFGLSTRVIAGRKWGGQLQQTTDVENFPGFGLIQGPELMKKMLSHVTGLGVGVDEVWAKSVTTEGSPFTITLEDDKTIQAKAVIIATGADTKWLEVPNEARLRGKGVSACAPCDAFFFRGRPVAVVGGGDSAMEEAHVIAKVASDVILIHRRDAFKAQQAMVDKVKACANMRFLYNTSVVDVEGEPTLRGLLLKTETISPKQGVDSFDALVAAFGGEKRSDNTWFLPRAGVFVAIGLVPNTQFLPSLNKDNHGYLLRKEEREADGRVKYAMKTDIEGLFTAGDVHDNRYKQAITAAGFGAMAALDVQQWLSEH